MNRRGPPSMTRRAGYQRPEKLGPRLVEKSREKWSSGSHQLVNIAYVAILVKSDDWRCAFLTSASEASDSRESRGRWIAQLDSPRLHGGLRRRWNPAFRKCGAVRCSGPDTGLPHYYSFGSKYPLAMQSDDGQCRLLHSYWASRGQSRFSVFEQSSVGIA